MTKPKPPVGLGAPGKKLWRWLVAFDPEVHELAQVVEAARIADRLAELDRIVRREGLTTTDHRGNIHAHPALVEARQQALALNRTLAALNIPSGGAGEWDNLTASQRARKAALTRHYPRGDR
jgi:hypothetical protein